MAAPTSIVQQMAYRNPHASAPLFLPVLVVCNTPDDDINRNIRANAALDREWLKFRPANDRIAVMVGGGPSAADHIEDIRRLKDEGATVFAMNGASAWLRKHGIVPDWQVIVDAKPETASLVDAEAKGHLFGSQVDPATMQAVPAPIVWHLEHHGGIDQLLPAEKTAKGYTIVGGGSVGNSGLCVAYVMGFRAFHCFGYDSSHRGVESHAYRQPMNDFIPTIDVEWAGKTYTASVAMKAQAEKFQITGQALKQEGCTIEVHGDGLLPAMWNTPVRDITERDKYRIIWQFDGYRRTAPGEHAVEAFLEVAQPVGRIIDFGCGTGRAALKLAAMGHEVFCIDFADNCRDEEAIRLPFLEWDLCNPIPIKGDFGYCTDVMEHIPPDAIETVIGNIMASVGTCFFQISTVPDRWGALIGSRLHLSVHDGDWWRDLFTRMGFAVTAEDIGQSEARFVVTSSQTGT